MKLRQKLFAAILAVMVVVFLLMALASFLNALEVQTRTRDLHNSLERGVAISFHRAAADASEESWRGFTRVMASFADRGWRVRREAGGSWIVATQGGYTDAELIKVASHNGYELLMPPPRGPQLLSWLSGLFWAVAAGTAFLMLIVYGLLLRLVLRPIENLVAASRVLSDGKRPAKVAGEWRSDEMGELIGAFNSMAEEVVTGRDALRDLVEKATADYRRAHEQLVIEQRLSATGKLAAGVAHEISNPLGGMINAARAIEKEEGLSERAREYVGLINDGLARVRDIVERMRTFVRPKPAVGPVDVAEAVKGALSFARHRVKDEGVELEEDYPSGPAAPARTVGDAGELQQVFLNLVMNALDAVKESDTKRVRLRVVREETGVVAEIADTGVGMDEERLANAFDLFYSTKDMSAEGEGGTGLGLAIAHKIVTDHGGEIELESSPGEGTVARVRLPPAH
jgi:two-component system NtrC family sensor kinase